MSKIPTAESIIDKHYSMDKDEDGNKIFQLWSVKDAMIEFAKLHVEAQDRAIRKNLIDNFGYIDQQQKLLDYAYPLSNIK